MSSGRATLAGCIALALWTFLAPLSRLAQPAPPLGLAALAFGIAALSGTAVLAATGRLHRLRAPPAAWAHGVAGLAGYHALYFAALAWAPAVPANLLNYTWPLLTVLLAVPLRGLPLGPLRLAGVALGAAGVLVLLATASPADGNAPQAALGLVCAAAAALTWALYSLLAVRFATVPAEAVVGFCAAAAVLLGVAHAILEPAFLPPIRAWPAILLLGIGPMGAAFWLWDFGMKRGDPRLLGTLAYGVPVGSTLLLVGLGEGALTAPVIAATLAVVAGGALAAAAGRAAPGRMEPSRS